MKHLYLLSAAALTAATAMGATPMMRHAAPAKDIKKVAKVSGISRAAEINNEVIWEAPEGKETLLSRSCDGFITQAYEATHSRIVGSTVRMVEAEDGKVYLNHIASEYPINTYVEATREGDLITISGVNAVYLDYDYDLDDEMAIYVVPMRVMVDENGAGTCEATDDLTYSFRVGADGSLTATDPELMLGICQQSPDPEFTDGQEWIWIGFGDRDVKMTPVTSTTVAIPDGLEMQRWVFSDEYDHAFVNVAIDGSDFYFQGADRSLPEAWIKGEIKGDKVVFPSGQYLGPDEEIYYLSYFCGADFVEEDGEMRSSRAEAAEFTYDAAAKQIKSVNGYVISSSDTVYFPLYGYPDVTVGVQTRDVHAVPAAPYNVEAYPDYGDTGLHLWFQLPNTDVDGKLLDTDRLYYVVEIHGEAYEFDLYDFDTYEEYSSTMVPYDYDDQFDFWVAGQDHSVYVNINEFTDDVEIYSVYINEEGAELRSAPGIANSVEEVEAARVVGEAWYDLQGRRISRPAAGMAIRSLLLEGGAVKTSKVIVR